MSSSSPGFTPAATPPPGVTPNFEHPRGSLHTIDQVNTYVCLIVVVIFAAIRLYVKIYIKRGLLLLEDYFFLAAWILTVFFAVGIILLLRYGEGYYVWEISQDTYKEFLKWLYVCAVVYIPAAYATKVTILLLIARVFSVKERIATGLRYFIICLAIAYLPIQIPKIVVCIPISAYWEITAQVGVTGKNPYCLNQTYLFIADICIAVATDVLILVLPIPLAMSMQALSFRQKIKIIVLLSAGGAATATTVYRMVKIIQFLHSTDPTRDFTVLSIFTLLELVIGLICACLPSVNILVKTLRKRPDANFNSPNVPRSTARVRGNSQPHSDLSMSFTSLWRLSLKSKRTATTVQTNPYGARDQGLQLSRYHSNDTEELPPRILDFEAELAMFCDRQGDSVRVARPNPHDRKQGLTEKPLGNTTGGVQEGNKSEDTQAITVEISGDATGRPPGPTVPMADGTEPGKAEERSQ